MLSSLSQIALLCVTLFVLHRLRARVAQRKHTHPPGPRGLPLLGNLFDVPPMPTWVKYLEWSRTYNSPIVRLNLLGQNVLVCNTLQTVLDLLDKRSAIYSDRPCLTMSRELCGWYWATTGIPYGKEWRTHRKLFHAQFHSQTVKQWRPIEMKATHNFLRRLLDTPGDFMHHIRHLAGDQTMRMAYGIQVQPNQDLYLNLVEEAMACGRAVSTAGAYMVDMFPILKYIPWWFPGARFKRQAREWKKSVQGTLDKPYEDYLGRVASGDVPDCIATSLLDDLRSNDKESMSFTENDAKEVLATIYAAGSDTTVSTIQSFILAMLLYPEVQRKAQAELDRICIERLPDFDDYDSLPYIEAIFLEALRWNPVVPEAVPHTSIEDDVYEGFFIPKGTLIVPNSWAILHEEDYYPDPFVFNPDRFIKDGKLNPDVLDPSIAAFGYGRRVCPGRFLARDSVWIAVVSVLALFDIQLAKDSDGELIVPSGEYENSFLCNPIPFVCDIQPRSLRHRALVIGTGR